MVITKRGDLPSPDLIDKAIETHGALRVLRAAVATLLAGVAHSVAHSMTHARAPKEVPDYLREDLGLPSPPPAPHYSWYM